MSTNAANNQAMLNLFREATDKVEAAILKNYNVRGPRYTSYPTVPAWNESFDAQAYRQALRENREQFAGQNRPLSLYVHLPFCESRCLFCSCNVVITRNQGTASHYLDVLEREINLAADEVDTTRPVTQLHWGGGTPTYHNAEQLERVFHMLKRRFTFSPDAEIALEIDPRVTTEHQLGTLRKLGFNRVSMGLQDVDQQVQAAVHRLQSREQTEDLLQAARDLGFQGTNLDLIYGLPYQTLESFNETLDQVLELSPDRFALYNFAFVPWLSPWQKALPQEAMPSGEQKFEIFKQAITRFMEAGYIYIGMDHFAKPEDELSLALEAGTLHRNFMGYTTRAGQGDLLGFGVSAISALDGAFSQNVKPLPDYENSIKAGNLPGWRGMTLSEEDKRRRHIILTLLCQGRLDFTQLSDELGLDFQASYEEELKALQSKEEDGLIELSANGLELLPLGRIFSRNVAMVFDAYLTQQQSSQKPIFSKTL